MDKFSNRHFNDRPAIEILNNHTFCQNWLSKNPLFKPFCFDEWKWDKNLKLNIENENVEIRFESAVETILVFESDRLRNVVMDWLTMNDIESPKYWAELAPPILKKLQSKSLEIVRTGLLELKEWVLAYNNHYVDNMLCNVDLSIFGYNPEDAPEGDLWSNPLFDNILEKYELDLNQNDLCNIIVSLFNGNEEFMDCKATFLAVNLLLKNRNSETEALIVTLLTEGLKGCEPGHRYYETSFLDRLVDDIFPTFGIDSIIQLLQNSHPDNIRKEGDNFVSLAEKALNSNPTKEQKKALEFYIKSN